MGIFDTAQDFINRGVASAERGGKTISLKVELADAGRQREQAYARLGEQVFATMGTDAAFRVGREELLDEVQVCVDKCAEIEARIAHIEAQGAAARAAAPASSRPCPGCGSAVSTGYKFCPACGAAVPESEPAPQSTGKTCPSCGFTTEGYGRFCMKCGTRLGEGPAAAQPQQPAWESAPAATYETPTGMSAPVTEIKPERVE